jgi:hypothetical protein
MLVIILVADGFFDSPNRDAKLVCYSVFRDTTLRQVPNSTAGLSRETRWFLYASDESSDESFAQYQVCGHVTDFSPPFDWKEDSCFPPCFVGE